MSRRLYEALYLIDATEHTARLKTPLAQIDARAKLVVLLTFLLTMLSLPTERLSNLMLFAIYPITMAAAAGIGYGQVLRRSLIIIPFVALIALPNIFYQREPMLEVYGVVITRGWITLLAITLRGILAVQGVVVMIASTGLYGTCRAMQRLGVPHILASQIYLTLRYIRLMVEQALHLQQAVESRLFSHKTLPLTLWARLTGRLLLLSIGRGEAVGRAMASRGFVGQMPQLPYRHTKRWRRRDSTYLVVWCGTLLLLRVLHFAEMIF